MVEAVELELLFQGKPIKDMSRDELIEVVMTCKAIIEAGMKQSIQATGRVKRWRL